MCFGPSYNNPNKDGPGGSSASYDQLESNSIAKAQSNSGGGIDDLRSARTNAPTAATASTVRSEAMRGSRVKKNSGIVRRSLFHALF